MDDDSLPPTTPQASAAKSGSSPSWKGRLRALNWPQKLLLLTATVLAALLLSAAIYQAFFEKPPPAPTVTIPATASVSITAGGLSPATITIRVGTQLTWTNNDSASHQPAADPHPLNNSIEGFDSDTTLLPGDSLSFTFEKAGTYTYHDHLNPLNKKYQGTVVVE